jgi:hypothetical protein
MFEIAWSVAVERDDVGWRQAMPHSLLLARTPTETVRGLRALSSMR